MANALSVLSRPLLSTGHHLDTQSVTKPFILEYAKPLLLLVNSFNRITDLINAKNIQIKLIDELTYFETQLVKKQVSDKEINALIYCFCAVFDEILLKKSWSSQQVWKSLSLLQHRYTDSLGGERIYTILEDLLKQSQVYLDTIECLYYLMSLGFEGKYYQQDTIIREELRYRILYLLKRLRPAQQHQSLICYLHKPLQKQVLINAHFKKRLSYAALFMVACSLILNSYLYYRAQPFIQLLNTAFTESALSTFSPLVDRAWLMVGGQ